MDLPEFVLCLVKFISIETYGCQWAYLDGIGMFGFLAEIHQLVW